MATDTPPPMEIWYRRYILMLLLLAFIFAMVDRQIVAVLQESIKQELHISDTQLGILTGVTFALFYATMGIPIGRLADRWNRAKIIAISIALWSVMTMLSGAATSFGLLLIFRIGVGIGEAGCSPSAISIIADYYEAHERPRAMAIFSAGSYIGISIGYFSGGLLNQAFGWRVVMLTVGAAGALLAPVILFTLREPLRIDVQIHDRSSSLPRVSYIVQGIFSNPTFRHLIAGISLYAFVAFIALAWTPSFYARVYHLSSATIGESLGTLALITTIGIYLGGTLADTLSRRDLRWVVWIPAIARCLHIPAVLAQYWAPSATVSFLFGVLSSILIGVDSSFVFSNPQLLVSAKTRAIAAAVVFLCMNTIGFGIGPLIAGVLNDYFRASFNLGQDAIRYSLSILAFVNLWSAFHYYAASRTIRSAAALRG